jgi:catechol 2,3-dioxygenase-like lactoylglutathione lyase family enzyme
MLHHISFGMSDLQRSIAFVIDPDGYAIEAVFKGPESGTNNGE